jgi:hypothetical protein
VKSKIRTLIELVEAGELELAQDFVDDARGELHAILEWGVQEDRSPSEIKEAVIKAVGDLYEADPSVPDKAGVAGHILIADLVMPNGNRFLSMRYAGSMNAEHMRIGSLQMATASQMEEHL